MKHIILITTIVLIPLIAHAFSLTYYLKRPLITTYKRALNLREHIKDKRQSKIPLPPYVHRKSMPVNGGTLKKARSIEPSNDDYETKCLLPREPSLKEDPTLFFFSYKNHSPQTLGCQVDMKIYLNTTYNDESGDLELLFDEESVENQLIDSELYDGSKQTFVLIHGFLASWNGNWLCNTKDLILNNSDANVFIVDWSGGAKPVLPLDYGWAVGNTKYVSQLVSTFLNKLLQVSGQTDASKFHLIGHSLGAHISGFVGYSLNSLGRITALDPAGPCFTSRSEEEEIRASRDGYLDQNRRRLSPESARFVLALHTDTSLFGLNENCAHHDIYVNGGKNQPGCGALSVRGRMNDLLNLNIEELLNPNIVCSHSYAHQILDTFVIFSNQNELSSVDMSVQENPSIAMRKPQELKEKCYPMAYECQDWRSFKSGECGFCFDEDKSCIYTGLTLTNFRPQNEPTDQPLNMPEYRRITESSDDAKFNDEDEGVDSDDGLQSAACMSPERSNRGQQYFMKTSPKTPSCLYHYQMIIASRKWTLDDAKNHYYYMQIPLEQSGRLIDPNGNRLEDRLIQVSHKVEPSSPAYYAIANNYFGTTRSQNLSIQVQSQNIEFFTALITFKQAPLDECQSNETDEAMSKKRQICKPLNNLKEAWLWSSSESKLGAVEWVSMNYMSGLDYSQRLRYSYLFEPDFTQNVSGYVKEPTPRSFKSPANVIKGFTKPVNCLLRRLDESVTDQAATNFKCNRIASELRYAIKLWPIKLRMTN